MKNPCTRDCPDRRPGCDCEKRRAWKWQQERIKAAKRRNQDLGIFVRDKYRRLRRQDYLPKDRK